MNLVDIQKLPIGSILKHTFNRRHNPDYFVIRYSIVLFKFVPAHTDCPVSPVNMDLDDMGPHSSNLTVITNDEDKKKAFDFVDRNTKILLELRVPKKKIVKKTIVSKFGVGKWAKKKNVFKRFSKT
tara:strand:+ start:3430 stop:3807 length:378 start_codon:yes stop_codon:yes gene_type:complete